MYNSFVEKDLSVLQGLVSRGRHREIVGSDTECPLVTLSVLLEGKGWGGTQPVFKYRSAYDTNLVRLFTVQ